MTTSTSFIMALNKAETGQYNYGNLPEYIQAQLQALYKAGVYMEVLGGVSKQWQPMSLGLNTGREWFFKKNHYYRLFGNESAAVRRVGSKQAYVYVTDVEALPETAVPFSCGERGIICHVTNLS